MRFFMVPNISFGINGAKTCKKSFPTVCQKTFLPKKSHHEKLYNIMLSPVCIYRQNSPADHAASYGEQRDYYIPRSIPDINKSLGGSRRLPSKDSNQLAALVLYSTII